MKRKGLLLFTLLIAGFLLSYCIHKDQKQDKNPTTDKWYSETKVEILKQSALQADSTVVTENDDRTFRKVHYYSNGHEYLTRGYNKGILHLEIYYSIGGAFELRREICDNGNYGFEGIVYQDNFYGLSTWRHCSGKLSEQGYRYNDEKVGVWKKYDRDGELTEQFDYGSIEKLESLPLISKK